MKELDLTGEWLTKNGSYANVFNASKVTVDNTRYKFFGNVGETKEKLYGVTHWDADGKCPGYSGWDLQERLDGYSTG